MKTSIETIIEAVNTKNEATHSESINNLVTEVLGGMDEFSRNQFLKVATKEFKGQKGRIKSPFTPEKVVGNGQRGRPSDSDEVKAAKAELKAKQKAEFAALTKNLSA